MKKYLFGILAVALAIGFSAFTTKSSHKTFGVTTYIFDVSTGNDDVRSGQTDHLVTGIGTDAIRNVTSWDGTVAPSYATGFKLAAMTFDENDDTKLSLAEAMAGVQAEYINQTLSSTDPQVISVTGANGTFNVTLRKKAN